MEPKASVQVRQGVSAQLAGDVEEAEQIVHRLICLRHS